jgi:hypothetical protein
MIPGIPYGQPLSIGIRWVEPTRSIVLAGRKTQFIIHVRAALRSNPVFRATGGLQWHDATKRNKTKRRNDPVFRVTGKSNETKQKQNKIIQREKTPGDVRTTPLVLWPLPFVRYPGVGCRANETTSRQRLLPVSNKQTNKDGFL